MLISLCLSELWLLCRTRHTRKRKKRFAKQSNPEFYYDMYEDWTLIESSFAQQYNIRLRNEPDMTWDEFSTLLSGLSADTALGNIVRIRSETDPKVIKNFSTAEKRIYNEWKSRKMRKTPKFDEKEYMKQMEMLEKAFASLL
ncbi:MAG: hypothetical protein IJH14_06475 [Solobacterium sp.]|nr:hypothetical protein [Solobacterium sp.]